MCRPGFGESDAQGIVEDVADVNSPIVTRDMLRAELYRALWIQGTGIVAVIGGIIGITEVIG
ncbi:MAG: hypothetical protein OXK16_05495 [bacterium]|nr:hypothetical protein [bacterium]